MKPYSVQFKGDKQRRPLIEATSQQTRFDPVTSSTQSSFFPSSHNPTRELDIKDISLTIGGKAILQDANLKILPGVKYLLHGQNGTGKSTILKALKDRLIPGVPSNVVISLLQQREGDEMHDEEHTEGKSIVLDEGLSALDLVVKSDEARTKALERRAILQDALEDTNDSNAPINALRQIKHEDHLHQLGLAKKEAELRSGARGAKARKTLIVMESEVEKSLAGLQLIGDDSTLAQETDQAVQMLAQLDADLEAMSSDTAHVRAENLLLGLGFTRTTIKKPLKTLSGGWRMRAHLASALFVPCHILLLDEPSSFLDFSSLLWLEDYLSSSINTRGLGTILVLVSHDRRFADNITDELLLLKDQKVDYFSGNLSSYYVELKKQQKRFKRMKEAQEKQITHIEKTISNNLKLAKKSGDDKKLKQVAARSKKLDERMGLQVSSKGGRFKLNRDLVGYHTNRRAEIEIPKDDYLVKFKLPTQPETLRFPGPLIGCEALSFNYYIAESGKKKMQATPIFENVNLSFRLGDKIGFVGLNGAGKSTLISCLVGSNSSISIISSASSVTSNIEELGKLSGSITRHPGAVVGYYSQEAVNHLPSDMTALTYLSLATEQETRSALASLGLTGRVVSDVKISDLSGGQRVRVALAKILFPVTPHVLVLDEVTTHLDADTVQILSEQLRRFKGTLILVSHDRWFMNAVLGEKQRNNRGEEQEVEESSSEDSDSDGSRLKKEGMVFWVDRGKVKRLQGGVDEFEVKIKKRAEKARKADGSASFTH